LKSITFVGVVGLSGSLLEPGGNIIVYYTWGLGTTSNNIIEAYALYEGLCIMKERNITKIVVFRDSMIIVRLIAKRSQTDNNLLNGIIYRILSLGTSFVEFKIHYIRRNLNSLADHWAKIDSTMERGIININRERGVFDIT
jgi:ribonuclease HI